MASIVEKRLKDGSRAWLVRFRTADGHQRSKQFHRKRDAEPPNRLYDSRQHANSGLTVNEVDNNFVPHASGVLMNYTMTSPAGGGFTTVFPEGTALPITSNVNVTAANQTIANFGVTQPTRQRISVYSSVATQFIADVCGHFVYA
jgi:hypothetical protein